MSTSSPLLPIHKSATMQPNTLNQNTKPIRRTHWLILLVIALPAVAYLAFSVSPSRVDLTPGAIATRLAQLRIQSTESSPSSSSSSTEIEQDADTHDLQLATEQFSIFRHTGGIGPYVQYPGFGLSLEPPQNCVIKQVHMLARHTERYPTAGKTFNKTVAKLQAPNVELRGGLALFKDYEYFVSDWKMYGQLTRTGPYNGVREAVVMGQRLAERYADLAQSVVEELPVFAGSSSRVVETAKMFVKGFQDSIGETKARVIVIPETKESGADTLTPSKSCSLFQKNKQSHKYHNFFLKYFASTVKRLQSLTSADISLHDVQNLMEMCYFELNVKQNSRICSLFTSEEHTAYGYTRSLRYYYRNGPGATYSSNMGSLYANATLKLLQQSSADSNATESLPFYFSFSHDTDLNFFYSLLGFFSGKSPLPYNYMDHLHPWVYGSLTPMGGNIIFEKLECIDDGDDSSSSDYSQNSQLLSTKLGENMQFYDDVDETTDPEPEDEDEEDQHRRRSKRNNGVNEYIRLVINDAVVPIPHCQSGPQMTCSLEDFIDIISDKIAQNPYNICEIDPELPQDIKFFWNWKNYSDDSKAELIYD